MSGHGLFWSHLLSFDAVLKIQAAQGRDRYPFVSELPVEVHCPLFHGQTRPVLECDWTDQELNMLVRKLTDHLPTVHGPPRQKSGPAYVLNFVTGKVQGLSYALVRNKLRLLRNRLGGLNPKYESDCSQPSLPCRSHLLVFHYAVVITITFKRSRVG